uniref:ERV-F(C)1 provirus ancestral Env polyprotein n=1 Tax=Anthurium amnicola TaxID=1678845 RepID=A0A1D1XKH4_9ARAE
MVQRCCCFINLRIGTILISLVVLVQSLVGVYVTFHFLDPATNFSKALGYVHGVWNILRAIMAFGGLVGGIMQNQRLIKLFSVIISISALIYLVFGLSTAIVSIKNKDKLADMCFKKVSEQAQGGNYWSPLNNWSRPFDKRQENSTDNAVNNQSEQELCQQAIKFYLGFVIAYTIFGFLLMFYFASVIANYREELRKNELYNKVKELDESRPVEPEKPPRGISRDI